MPDDRFGADQTALLRKYYLERERCAADSWSADCALSLSPFVPCAERRIPHVLRACRLTDQDVLWDLGCGDGRLLHQAVAQYGCRAVGVDIDAPCVAEACARAAEQQLDHRCQFACVDLSALKPGALRRGADGCVDLGSARRSGPDAPGTCERLAAPTVLLLFLTSHGLTRISRWLHGEWLAAGEVSAGDGPSAHAGLRIVTCVESLTECFDFEAEDPLFDEEADRADWPVYEAHAADGIYVVPPRAISVPEWAEAEGGWAPVPAFGPAEADAVDAQVMRGVLSADDIQDLHALARECMRAEAAAAGEGCGGEGADGADGGGDACQGMAGFDLFSHDADACAAAEEAWHASPDHRVVYLHRDWRLGGTLPRLLERVLCRVRQLDAARWRQLLGRSVSVRSAELHTYRPGGSVADPEHRDHGSLLTLSVLLTPPDEFEGGAFLCEQPEAASAAAEQSGPAPVALGVGDGVLFPSEKRHNVSTLTRGMRCSFVLELWEGDANRRNRHS